MFHVYPSAPSSFCSLFYPDPRMCLISMCLSVLDHTHIMDGYIMDMQYLTSSSTSYSQLDHSLSQKPPDKCRSDIGAAGMRSKYAPNILSSGILHIITPLVKMASAWEEAEIMSSLWTSSALNGFRLKHWEKGGTRRKRVLAKLCDFRGGFIYNRMV